MPAPGGGLPAPGGCLVWGVSAPGGSAPGGMPGPGGLPGPGGCLVPGAPQTATAAGSTHPPGMHSCVFTEFSKFSDHIFVTKVKGF